MLFNSKGFQAMQYGLDALWMKQKIHTNNIANHDTPGFKTQSLSFEDVLKDISDGASSKESSFRATIVTDENSIRPDGNNVNIEKENIELYRTYAQAVTMYQKIGGQFKNMRYVINQTLK